MVSEETREKREGDKERERENKDHNYKKTF